MKATICHDIQTAGLRFTWRSIADLTAKKSPIT